MNPEELKETAEHAHEKGEKGIGLTMAIVAVLLAVATLLSHRAHTEEVLLQGEIIDQWNFYQAKHIRAYEFGAIAELATLFPNGKDLALKDLRKSAEEECGVPVEKGCASPNLKDSPILQQLSSEKTSDSPVKKTQKKEDADAKAHGAEPKESPAHGSAEKHEKPAKESARKPGAGELQKSATEMEEEKKLMQRRANYYDASELFLEVSLVLCSVALLSGTKRYWLISFVSTFIGVGVILWGLLLH
jgi:hypothetical protein